MHKRENHPFTGHLTAVDFLWRRVLPSLRKDNEFASASWHSPFYSDMDFVGA